MAELVSPEPEVVAEAVVAAQLVVAAVAKLAGAEQALVVEALEPLLSPALVRLLTPDHRQALPLLCSLQQCRPL